MQSPPASNQAVLFQEVQAFRKDWPTPLFLLIVGIPWISIAFAVLVLRTVGKPVPPAFAWGIGLAMSLAFSLFMSSLKLTISVRSDGLFYRYFPFHLSEQRLGFEEIAEHKVREYRPLVEYGGWGIRNGPKGKAYNVVGKKGVQLVLTSGKRVLFGSQRAEELAGAIESASKANPAIAWSGK